MEKVATIDGIKIHYKVFGSGPNVLLLIHGAVGSYSDFSNQMQSATADGVDPREFTIVAPDLPGCGRSATSSEAEQTKPVDEDEVDVAIYRCCRPSLAYFKQCARVCSQLMRQLGHRTYSVGGWSDGARVAALLAIGEQSRVNALLLWAFAAQMDERSCLALARQRDTSSWEPSCLAAYSQVYGEDKFSCLWREYVDFGVRIQQMDPEQLELVGGKFDIRHQLKQIKCPTLVLHGDADPIIDFDLHIKPMEWQICDLSIERVAKSAHNIHQAAPAKFNQTMRQFVSSAMAC